MAPSARGLMTEAEGLVFGTTGNLGRVPFWLATYLLGPWLQQLLNPLTCSFAHTPPGAPESNGVGEGVVGAGVFPFQGSSPFPACGGATQSPRGSPGTPSQLSPPGATSWAARG